MHFFVWSRSLRTSFIKKQGLYFNLLERVPKLYLDGALELAFFDIRNQVENFYKLLTWKTVVLSPWTTGNDLSMTLWPSLVFQSQWNYNYNECKGIHVSKRYTIPELAYVNAQVFHYKSIHISQFQIDNFISFWGALDFTWIPLE